MPVPDVSPEEEALLFGQAGQTTSRPQEAPNPFESPPATPAQAQASPAGSQAGRTLPTASGGGTETGFQAIVLEMLRQQNQSTLELLRQQGQATQQNQQLIAALMRRMDLEEKRRNEAEEKAAETAKLVAEAAAKAKTADPFSGPGATAATGSSSSTSFSGGSTLQNRAEKYLPPLPLLEHQGMSKGRMREVETWHGYVETLSSWLALQDESFVRELQLCVKVKHEILQKDLSVEVAARSAKLFYYLTQALAKWERGLELLRSCSKRQALSACGYEAMRTITQQYSIVSRMEAVFVRDQCLKLQHTCQHIRRPTDLIRHLEDEFSRSEAKLSNFPELLLSEADRCSILLQAVNTELRQYVVLHGKSNDWNSLCSSLKYYEEQLRLCEAPGGTSRSLSDTLCDYCGKRGHQAEKCWQKQRDEKARGGGSPDKGKGDHGKDRKTKEKGTEIPKVGELPKVEERRGEVELLGASTGTRAPKGAERARRSRRRRKEKGKAVTWVSPNRKQTLGKPP